MYTYEVCPLNSLYCIIQNLKADAIVRYTYQVRLVNLRCLYQTILKVEPIDHVYLPDSSSQLALFALINS